MAEVREKDLAFAAAMLDSGLIDPTILAGPQVSGAAVDQGGHRGPAHRAHDQIPFPIVQPCPPGNDRRPVLAAGEARRNACDAGLSDAGACVAAARS